MRRSLLIALIAMALGAVFVSPAAGITNGEPDGDNHPYVGLAVFDVGGGPAWRCSASLLSPTLVLTAGHCTDGADTARVWFDEIVQGNPEYPFAGATSYEGTPYTHPDYQGDNPYGGGNGLPAFAYRDVGIIVLSEPVPIGVVSEYAQLPAVGVVDTLKNKTDIDFVGYGVQYQEQIKGSELPQPPPFFRWTGPRARMYAPSALVSGKFVHSAEFMRLALNPGGGSGGTCFGDSGGPDLLAGTDTVLAVNSYVTNVNCSGVGYSSRVDIAEVLDWISDAEDFVYYRTVSLSPERVWANGGIYENDNVQNAIDMGYEGTVVMSGMHGSFDMEFDFSFASLASGETYKVYLDGDGGSPGTWVVLGTFVADSSGDGVFDYDPTLSAGMYTWSFWVNQSTPAASVLQTDSDLNFVIP